MSEYEVGVASVAFATTKDNENNSKNLIARFGEKTGFPFKSAKKVRMYGFQDADQFAKRVDHDLKARAFMIRELRTPENPKPKFVVIVLVDIWSCFRALKDFVIANIDTPSFNHKNIMIMGTHTHAGPALYSDYKMYNAFGIEQMEHSKKITKRIGQAISDAIHKAHMNITPGRVFMSRGVVGGGKELRGANRSKKAVQKNKDKDRLARSFYYVNPEMTMLKFVKSKTGKVLGCINWYAIHPNNLWSKYDAFHGDSKGYAEYHFEKEYGVVAAFANSACGDVSGNAAFGSPPSTRKESVRRKNIFGKSQLNAAKQLFDEAQQLELRGPVDFFYKMVNMTNVKIRGTKTQRTYPAALGFSMFGGSHVDGVVRVAGYDQIASYKTVKNMSPKEWDVAWWLSNLMATFSGTEAPVRTKKNYKDHNPKPIVYFPGDNGPKKLPVQILRVGSLLLPALPGEATTFSGLRLCDAVERAAEKKFGEEVFDRCVLCCYANDYSQYTATEEEYDMQSYEGASTLFGRHQLKAYIQEFQSLLE